MSARASSCFLYTSKEIETAFLDYSMSVIVSRALPDVRDGLKPVHRRILYTMHERGNDPSHAYRKSADTVGAVLGSYHPHGDASVYDAMVRLAQDFSLRYPLVDGQGNFGSVDGDPPAAYRYTEARMSRMAVEMLTDIDKDTIDWDPNFDETKKEPSVLPCRFPNLLVLSLIHIFNLPYIMPIDGIPQHLVMTLTRAKFEQLCDHLIHKRCV